MTADSEATTLENKNNAVVDMRAGADKLEVGIIRAPAAVLF